MKDFGCLNFFFAFGSLFFVADFYMQTKASEKKVVLKGVGMYIICVEHEPSHRNRKKNKKKNYCVIHQVKR